MTGPSSGCASTSPLGLSVLSSSPPLLGRTGTDGPDRGYGGDVARRPQQTPKPDLEFIDDGLTDDAREAAMASWFEEFDRRPAVDVAVSAADTLAEARAEGEV